MFRTWFSLSAGLLLCLAPSVLAKQLWTNSAGDKEYEGVLEETSSLDQLKGLCDTVDQQAGYFKISGSKNKNYFYWYFHSRDGNPNAPVILWLTGGPGCSSGVALFHENGPCKVNTDHKTTSINPYGWNSNASIVYIDQPAGVGFSYGDAGDEDHDEEGVARDMYYFLHEFSSANDDILSKNEFYIYGESYGGHYAPAIAYRVGQSLNLKGLSVGNGLTNPPEQYPAYPILAYNYSISKLGKPVIDEGTYAQMTESLKTCLPLIEECQNDTSKCAPAQAYCNNNEIGPYEQTGLNPYDIREPCKVRPLCYDFSDVSDFLDQPSVQAALGVPKMSWQSCNFTVNSMFSNDWMKRFDYTIAPLLANGTRVVIYAGDVDFICNWIGNKNWVMNLEWDGQQAFQSEGDHPWMVAGEQAGEARTHGGLTFLRVYDAGHMVPLDQPARSLDMVNTVITGGSFY